MALFPLPVKAEMSDRFKMPARVLQFGDGYEQTALAGLNRQQTTWDVEVIISSAAQNALFNAFLLNHGQHKSFTWQSPRDTSPQLYRITGDVSSTRRNGGGSKPVFFSRRMQFKSTTVDTTVESIITPISYVLDLNFNPLIPVDRTGKVVVVNGGYARSAIAHNSNFSGVFNGTNTWLSIPSSNDWNLNNTDEYEISVVLKVNTLNSFQSILSLATPFSTDGYVLDIRPESTTLYSSDLPVVRHPVSFPVGVWKSLKYTKTLVSGFTYNHKLFIDGIQVESNTSDIFISAPSEPLTIGCHENRPYALFDGEINSLKIRKF